MRRNLGLLLGLGLALAAGPAQAIPIANGDLVVVLQKAGTEVIVNVGSAFASHSVDLTSAATTLGGLEGAKVVGIGVQNPNRLSPDFGFGQLPQEDIIFTSLSTPVLDDAQIELSMNAVDTSLASTAWFWLLRSVSNPVIPTSAGFSYQNTLGLGTDAIANNLNVLDRFAHRGRLRFAAGLQRDQGLRRLRRPGAHRERDRHARDQRQPADLLRDSGAGHAAPRRHGHRRPRGLRTPRAPRRLGTR